MEKELEPVTEIKQATPITKRIGIVCLTVLSLASIIAAALGELSFDNALLVVIPAMTSISAMIDGGK